MNRLTLAALAMSLSACTVEAPSGPLVLSPDAETLPYAQEAAARWSAATGLEILIGAGGVPVTFGDYPLDHNASACSAAYVTRQGETFTRARIVITRPTEANTFCEPVNELMLHEVGHVIQERSASGWDVDRGHVSEFGSLMSEYGTGDGLIDSESLAKVCSRAPCTAFEPETAPIAEIAPVETEPCGFVFSPVPELLDATVAQAARWSTATGCDIRVGEGGLPVGIVDEIKDEAGNRKRGVARYDETGTMVRIDIERVTAIFGTSALPTVLGHEIGHVLGAHAHEGCLMASPTDLHAPICAADLEAVCASLACSAFQVER